MSDSVDTARRRTALLLIALACAYTLLNAIKPLHVDDPFTHHVAEQMVRDPLDPFGSEIFWYQWPQPVHEDLLAPVTGYWGALGLALGATDPMLWKLLLLPFALLFAVSLHWLARRFAAGLENWIVAATLFSPALLPSLNYMQDVPSLALGLGALALYLRAEDRGSIAGALVAGLVAGLAMQTKWTQLATPAAMLLHGVLSRRIGFSLLPVLVASALFAAWELFVTHRYGHGMFLFQLDFPFFWTSRWEMALPLLRLLGALLPVPALLALAARGVPRDQLAALALAIVGGWALLISRPLEHEVYLVSGLFCTAVLLATGASLPGVPRWTELRSWIHERRTDLFLIGWWLGSVATYFAMSYFPAVRRVLAIVIVATLLIARAASRRMGERALPLAPLLALQVILGLWVWGVDFLEARAQRVAAERAVATVRERDPDGAIWYVGHWGFQYYAESSGMRPLIPDYSEVRRGDWLVVPSRVDQQEVKVAPDAFELVSVVRVPSHVPLASLHSFYAGSTPLAHFDGPRITAQLLRAKRDVVPETAWPVQRVADWAMHASGKQAHWASRALARGLGEAAAPAELALAARALAPIGPHPPPVQAAIERAAQYDASPAVRAAAAQTLETLRQRDP